jgi:hypothetical protein
LLWGGNNAGGFFVCGDNDYSLIRLGIPSVIVHVTDIKLSSKGTLGNGILTVQ